MKGPRKGRIAACAAVLGVLAVVPGAQARPAQYYVSLGDSYAAGFQPGFVTTTDGFVYQVPGLARRRGYDLQVVNYGCVAASTATMLSGSGCAGSFLGPGAAPFTRSQVVEAAEFIRANRKKVALVTVSIGGNDFYWGCMNAADPAGCVRPTLATMKVNISAAARQLRQAAGNRPVLVGTTYPNMMLGAWVNPGGAEAQRRARRWVPVFRKLINPALKESYAAGRGTLADVTAVTGGYGDMKAMEALASYGLVPKPVADACRATWYCDKGDPHATRAGNRTIARLVAAQLPRR